MDVSKSFSLRLCTPVFAALTAISPNYSSADVFVQPIETMVNTTFQVPAGKFIYQELKLNKGETVLVELASSGGTGSIYAPIMDLNNFNKYRSRQTANVIEGTQGKIASATKFRFEVPATGIYYQVLDASHAMMASRTVKYEAQRILADDNEASIQLQSSLSEMYNKLKEMFIFPDFDIYVVSCGMENAFSTPDIYLCHELVDSLVDQQNGGALLFILLHELGHSLLYLWDYPLYDNEDAADEFAAVILSGESGAEYAMDAASWMNKNWSAEELNQKLWIDDRHTISPQRARNIINWLNKDQAYKDRWLSLLVPKMTDKALQEYSGSSNSTATEFERRLMADEMKKRGLPSGSKN